MKLILEKGGLLRIVYYLLQDFLEQIMYDTMVRIQIPRVETSGPEISFEILPLDSCFSIYQ